MNQNLSTFLNISRWLAALLVLISHTRHLILVDFQLVTEKTPFNKALYFITGLGHEAVVIFFVISGYLVGALTLAKWQSNGPEVRSYIVARVSRIYSVLIPALVFGAILDLIGLHWFNASELYTNSEKYHTISLSSIISDQLNPSTFIANLLMLQGISKSSFGSNGPLWSLAYEWWYYCVFAVIGIALTSKGEKRIKYLFFALILGASLPNKILLWGLIWLLGIVAHKWTTARVWQPHPALGFGLFVFAVVASRLSHNVDNLIHHETMLTEFFRDFLLAISYVLALVSVNKSKLHIRDSRLHEKLAEFSFSTYLYHFPAMVFLVAVCYQQLDFRFQVQPDFFSYVYLISISLVLYCYCYTFYYITERHTRFYRKKLEQLIQS